MAEKPRKNKSLSPKKNKSEQDNPIAYVDSVEEGYREAKAEAEEAGVTPAAVMRSAPEGAVTGDGVVQDPPAENSGDVEGKPRSRKKR